MLAKNTDQITAAKRRALYFIVQTICDIAPTYISINALIKDVYKKHRLLSFINLILSYGDEYLNTHMDSIIDKLMLNIEEAVSSALLLIDDELQRRVRYIIEEDRRINQSHLSWVQCTPDNSDNDDMIQNEEQIASDTDDEDMIFNGEQNEVYNIIQHNTVRWPWFAICIHDLYIQRFDIKDFCCVYMKMDGNWIERSFIDTYECEECAKRISIKISKVIFEELSVRIYHPSRHPTNYLSIDELVGHPYENITQNELKNMYEES